MFVGCVVAGRIISSSSSGIKSRGAQIRDVVMQLITVSAITLIFAFGAFTYRSVVHLLLLYGMYVIVVAVADFSKRAGVEWYVIGASISRTLTSGVLGLGGSDTTESAHLATPLLMENHHRVGANAEAGIAEDKVDARPLIDEHIAPTVTHAAATNTAFSIGGTQARQLNGVSGESQSGSTSESITEVEMTNSPGSKSPQRISTGSGMAYADLIHMPGKEYRRLALAGVAAATLKRGGTKGRGFMEVQGGGYDDDIEEGDDDEDYTDGGDGDGGVAERGEYAPPAVMRYSDGVHSADDLNDRTGAAPICSSSMTTNYNNDTLQGEEGVWRNGNASSGLVLHEDHHHHQHPEEWLRKQEASFQRKESLKRQNEFLQKMLYKLDHVAYPFMILLQLTIPLLEASSYKKSWFLTSMALSPSFICMYLGQWSMASLGTALVLGAMMSCVCYSALQSSDPIAAAAAAANDANDGNDPESPPFWDFGTGFPIGAALVAVYGFGIAAMWMDLLATQIVSILHFLGLLAGIHPAVLGVSVLAWGNSLPDLIANTSMAMRSPYGVSMAMTACFAGPSFNMLVGLGVGFWALLADTDRISVSVQFDPVVLVGCVFAMINCCGIVAVALLNKHWLPSRFGWSMIVWYGVYVAVMIIVGAI